MRNDKHIRYCLETGATNALQSLTKILGVPTTRLIVRTILLLLIAGQVLAACTSLSEASTHPAAKGTVTATVETRGANDIRLDQVPWCSHPLLVFTDGVTQMSEATWETARKQTNLTPYLPATLPRGTCVVAGWGGVNSDGYAVTLSVTYRHPHFGTLGFSETPPSVGGPAPNAPPDCRISYGVLCFGAYSTTEILMDVGHGTVEDVKALFGTLQPIQQWHPPITGG